MKLEPCFICVDLECGERLWGSSHPWSEAGTTGSPRAAGHISVGCALGKSLPKFTSAIAPPSAQHTLVSNHECKAMQGSAQAMRVTKWVK